MSIFTHYNVSQPSLQSFNYYHTIITVSGVAVHTSKSLLVTSYYSYTITITSLNWPIILTTITVSEIIVCTNTDSGLVSYHHCHYNFSPNSTIYELPSLYLMLQCLLNGRHHNINLKSLWRHSATTIYCSDCHYCTCTLSL